jgi:hypothetical protein
MIDSLKLSFQKLGASEAQAEIMAQQLLKRADQIAQAEGISKEAALGALLKKISDSRAS